MIPITSSFSTFKDIVSAREDISDYVFHFTKGHDALSNLKSILSQGKLIRGEKDPICFTAAPLYCLPKLFQLFSKYKDPMYAAYGIGFKKDYLFQKGGRPVIYGLEQEKQLLDKSIQWRFVKYEPNKEDFTWLREWRIEQAELVFQNEDCIVITTTDAELFSLTQEEGDAEEFMIEYVREDIEYSKIVEVALPLRHFRGISIEELKECCRNKSDFYDLLSWQDISKD